MISQPINVKQINVLVCFFLDYQYILLDIYIHIPPCECGYTLLSILSLFGNARSAKKYCICIISSSMLNSAVANLDNIYFS